MVILDSILLVWILLGSVLGVILGILWFLDDEGDVIIFWMPNHFAMQISNAYDLNDVGHCIVDIICSIVFLPTVLVAMVIVGLVWIPLGAMMLFAWIFRKR